MLSPSPRALPENEAFVFVGERKSPLASVPPRMAARMLAMHNVHGKPNSDVLRQFAVTPDPRRPGEYWQVDFPAGLSEHEASLYAQPFHHLDRAVRLKRENWWINPFFNPDLRAILAKHERFLATSLRGPLPEFRWVSSDLVPDESQLVATRADDFTSGVLAARPFLLWWQDVAPRLNPVLALKSYPFPWPPATRLGSLSAAQEELRHAIARAARTPDAGTLGAAVASAYGWPSDATDHDVLQELGSLHHRRSADPGTS